MRIISPDAGGNIDPTVASKLLDYLPFLRGVVVVPVSYMENFAFNAELERLRDPYVLVDFMEYFGAWEGKETHFFGVNPEQAPNYQSEDWLKFNDWVKRNPPLLYFKRELLEKDRSEHYHPIEFPCYLESWEIEGKAGFDSRPFDVFNCWGFSNCIRPMLHGDIFKNLCLYGLNVVSEFRQIERFRKAPVARTWITIFTPHFTRAPISEIVLCQAQSKMSVSLPGSGVKCFRSTEAPVNTVPAIGEDDMAWAFPWVHGVNCIRLRKGKEADDLFTATQREDLHQIYVNAQATLDQYRSERYAREYVFPLIKKAHELKTSR